MGSDVEQIFPTASLHRDHSIVYALVCEKELSHMGKNSGNPDLVCGKAFSITIHVTKLLQGSVQILCFCKVPLTVILIPVDNCK